MKKKHIIWIVIAVVVLIPLLLVSQYIGWKNRLVDVDENVNTAWAQVESQLQRRLDLIPNLVATVKGYAAHEDKVLNDVTRARASVAGATSTAEKIGANNELTGALSRLLVVVESYPNLKANQNFMALQDELAGTENRISVARQRYNEAARLFNTTRRKFPYSLVAGDYKEAAYFEAAAGAQVAPQVQF